MREWGSTATATFLLSFLVIAVGTSFCGHLSIWVAIVNCFHRKKAQAISMSSIGFAIGGLIVPLAVLALKRWGWRSTAFATGIFFQPDR